MIHFTLTDYVLWLISLVTSSSVGSFVAYRFWTGSLRKRWPIFSMYLACAAFRSTVLLVLFVNHWKEAYYNLYWWTEPILQLLTLLSILDVASEVGRYGSYLQAQTRKLVGYSMPCFLALGIGLSVLSSNVLSAELARVSTSTLKAVTLAWCLTVISLMAGSGLAGFTWRREPWLLTAGFVLSQSGMAIWAWCAATLGLAAIAATTRAQIFFTLIHFVPWIEIAFSRSSIPTTAYGSQSDLKEHLGGIQQTSVNFIGDK